MPEASGQGKGRGLADMSMAESDLGATLEGGTFQSTLCSQCGGTGPYVILMLHTPTCVFLGQLLNLPVTQFFSSVKLE